MIQFLIIIPLVMINLIPLIPDRTVEYKVEMSSDMVINRINLPVGNVPSSTIKSLIKKKAVENGISVVMALWIAEKESNFNPRVIGDGDKVCEKTGLPIRSRGLWQINDCAWPEISDEVAFDVIASTNFAMEQLKNGKENIWSAWKYRCKWYSRENPPNCF